MSTSGVRDDLIDRVMSIDPEEFEHLCKILVEEIERPPDIELTPFHADGGIDIRGFVGVDIYTARFGVQVKQYEGNIQAPAMRDFVGALSTHDYQFGAFITTSEFNSGAENIARNELQKPINLINRRRLTELMFSHEVGAIESAGSYDLDPEFWSIFDRSTTEQLVSTIEVPQADSLDILKHALDAIDRGYRHKPQITGFMERKTGDDWANRQADYYPSAGYALGYVHKDTYGEFEGRRMRRWGLTRDGQEYIELLQTGQTGEAEHHLHEHIRGMKLSKRILPVIKKEGSIGHDRLKTLVFDESELNETTANRRASTLGKWFSDLPEIRRSNQGHSYRYEFLARSLDDYSAP